ncbi:ETC complex I subunit [Cinnamomum micranthum f. kanehirae]|uniref:ETC complex I subunit n=1 Tax=Cinnamomum micranthum f. kanehirae TaxID=337451 RepID=A0A443NSJ2_9MAGN|nr:ETC complex I subunit [Cinnamomum micranthum f. kanehirae]
MFLRRFAGPLLAKVKETTGIVGLDVVPNAREVLISLYTKTLNEIKAVPEDEGYRKAVESFTKHRLQEGRRGLGADRETPQLRSGRGAHRRSPRRALTHRQDDRYF